MAFVVAHVQSELYFGLPSIAVVDQNSAAVAKDEVVALLCRHFQLRDHSGSVAIIRSQLKFKHHFLLSFLLLLWRGQ